jgi:Mg2+ and Co2+ transporter CorA
MLVVKTLISRIILKHFKPHITTTAGALSSTSRQHLAHQIEDTLDDRDVVEQLDDAIDGTKNKLEKMEESEQFLGTRIRRYRQMLAEHQMRLQKKRDTMTNLDRERHMKQQERYKLQICDVIDIHRNILKEVEILRRKLKSLEQKRNDFCTKRDECEEFLVASARLDLDNVCPTDDETELEMGVLSRVQPTELELS